ncbi:MAG TPA: LemA family protein [bacterium]|nr:LemA family protein [bacterium]
MAIATIIVIAIPVLIVLWVIMAYNGLVGWRNQVKNAWSQIDVQLKRRYDLIPNLVETVKGYAKHEQGTLEKVIQARNMAMNAHTPQEVGQAENVLQGTLKSLFALSENYPDLKANQNFLGLQEELTSTENKISFARQFYNDTVNRFNTMIQTFPKNMLAGMFGFQAAQLFEVDSPEERKAVKVQF